MAKRRTPTYLSDQSGAVAVTYALALVGLIVAAGVGFDYARLMTMDSELQSAADQAALAGATQLNGSSDAMARAVASASALVSNSTLLANDNVAQAVTISEVVFYKTRDHAENDTNGFTVADTTRNGDAKFIRVKTVGRKVFYAYTPIVGLLTSGDIVAAATAGLGSAICREPPLFVCISGTGITDPAAWVTARIGRGILMKAKGTSWSPGNFGFLETNAGSGANDIGKLLAYANPPGDCVSVEDPETAPGQKQSVVPDFNTRFDIFDNGDPINCWGGQLCPPAPNSRKDVVMKTTSLPTKIQDCGAPSGGWDFGSRPYRPTTAVAMSGATTADFPDVMGYPRDLCHAVPQSSQNCGGTGDYIGTGDWDINAYWWANYQAAYPGTVTTSVSGRTYATRYEVYKWEQIPGNSPAVSTPVTNAGWRNHRAPVCRTAAGSGVPDRRIIPVAVIDCDALNGTSTSSTTTTTTTTTSTSSGTPKGGASSGGASSGGSSGGGGGGGSITVRPLEWMDVFLVEPSLNRKQSGASSPDYTSAGDFYGEIVGRTGQGSGGTTSQTVRRDKPYLVK